MWLAGDSRIRKKRQSLKLIQKGIKELSLLSRLVTCFSFFFFVRKSLSNSDFPLFSAYVLLLHDDFLVMTDAPEGN